MYLWQNSKNAASWVLTSGYELFSKNLGVVIWSDVKYLVSSRAKQSLATHTADSCVAAFVSGFERRCSGKSRCAFLIFKGLRKKLTRLFGVKPILLHRGSKVPSLILEYLGNFLWVISGNERFLKTYRNVLVGNVHISIIKKNNPNTVIRFLQSDFRFRTPNLHIQLWNHLAENCC